MRTKKASLSPSGPSGAIAPDPGTANPIVLPTWVVPALAAVLLLLSIVVASQGGLVVRSTPALASVLYLLLTRLPVLGAWWLGALGWGWLLRRALLTDLQGGAWLVQAAGGAALLLWLNWALGGLGLLNSITAWGLVGVGIVVLLLRAGRLLQQKGAEPTLPRVPWTLVLAAPPLGLLLVACCCPPRTLWAVEAFGYDVTSYHLQLPREWLQNGNVLGVRHNVYSFLPSLLEAGYLQLGYLSGSVYRAIYSAQLLHASLAVLAACGVGTAVARRAGATIGIAASALFLAVPWTLITGSMAYNEMAVLAFAAAALVVLMEGPLTWRRAAVVGLLLGSATFAKLTAGFMLALPLGAVWFAGLLTPAGQVAQAWKQRTAMMLVIGLAATVTLSPYFLRNGLQTGNPVFPFAAKALGTGHWSSFEVERWNRGHAPSEPMAKRFSALAQHWLTNVGYGAVGGTPRQRQAGHIEAQNVARFERERGMPTLWLAVFLAAWIAAAHAPARKPVAAMAAVIALQVVFWLLATHLQSRFLIFTLLPGLVLLGLGLQRLDDLTRQRAGIVTPVVAGLLSAVLVLTSFAVLVEQTVMDVPVFQLIDTLPEESRLATLKPGDAVVGDHVLNHLPESSQTYLVADASQLLYIRRPFVYDSAFDVSLLGQLFREHQFDPARVTAALRQRGITHLWVHGPELARLHATYGYDAAVTFQSLQQLTAGWTVVENYGSVVLMQVPSP